ncbi:MAG: polysaccharide biosynthesis/export family protein [Bacteroidota bacterium]|nr:polysaccharide biosynthesis/export family protein [Bacteroidota bacterium]
MFQTKNEIISDSLLHKVKLAEKTYLIRKNDFISFQIFTNKGEVVVDPTGKVPSKYSNMQNGNNQMGIQQLIDKYLIYNNGYADLPMIGSIKLEGLSIHQVDSLLSKEYNKYYQESFAVSKVINKRVILTGAFGSKVIPLENENMNLIEVLAMTDQMGTATSSFAKFKNVRLIRGDLKNPNVYLIDLTSIEGLRKANLNVQPNDIIYVEPYRRVVLETIRDISPIVTLFTTTLTLTLTLILLSNR